MYILVSGATGQLGYEVCRELTERGIKTMGFGSKDCDICSREAVEQLFEREKPDVLIHCAAYTGVDKAEEDAERCWRVNAEGTGNLALACRKQGVKMLYVSTDYVFPGRGEDYYEPEDGCLPLGNYGRSKRAGELAVQMFLEKYFIVRTSWVFGRHGSNFVKTMLRLAGTQDTLRVVDDQTGGPTYAPDLASLLCDMAETEKYGIYHAANQGVCSWAEFAREIFRLAGKQVKVEPVTTAQYGAAAPRPLNSRLSPKKLVENGFRPLPPWQDALERYLKDTECEQLL